MLTPSIMQSFQAQTVHINDNTSTRSENDTDLFASIMSAELADSLNEDEILENTPGDWQQWLVDSDDAMLLNYLDESLIDPDDVTVTMVNGELPSVSLTVAVNEVTAETSLSQFATMENLTGNVLPVSIEARAEVELDSSVNSLTMNDVSESQVSTAINQTEVTTANNTQSISDELRSQNPQLASQQTVLTGERQQKVNLQEGQIVVRNNNVNQATLVTESQTVDAPKPSLTSNALGFQQMLIRNQLQLTEYQTLVPDSQKMISLDPMVNQLDNELAAESEAINPIVTSLNTATSQIAEASSTTIRLSQPIQSAQFSNQFAERIFWTARNNISNAEIHLNPAELGPLSAKIRVDDEKTSLVFMSQHLQVREAVEAAMPKLKSLFESSELELLDVTVSDQQDKSLQQRFEEAAQEANHQQNYLQSKDSQQTVHQASLPVNENRGLVDYYA